MIDRFMLTVAAAIWNVSKFCSWLSNRIVRRVMMRRVRVTKANIERLSG